MTRLNWNAAVRAAARRGAGTARGEARNVSRVGASATKRALSGLAAVCLSLLPAIVPAGAADRAPMSLHRTPVAMPAIRFSDGAGSDLSLADWSGRIVLLNVWATWCGPCRKEMPTLDRLQARLGGADFEVVALSIDRAGAGVVRRFYDSIGIENLRLFIDRTGRAASALRIPGLPATILIDRKGREIGRLVGPSEWDAPETVAFLTRRIEASGNGTHSGVCGDSCGGPARGARDLHLGKGEQR